MLSDDFLAARQSMMQATFECSDRKADGAYVFIDFNNSFIGTFVLMDGQLTTFPICTVSLLTDFLYWRIVVFPRCGWAKLLVCRMTHSQ